MQNFRRAAQRFFLLTIFFVTALIIAGCDDTAGGGSGGEPSRVAKTNADFSDIYKAEDTWVIQWYLCGTDLETSSGAATADLQELLNVKLPANVKVLIQTGGANQWQNNTVSSGAVERYLYDSSGLQRLATLPDADMGKSETLADFVNFGKDYEADHRVFVFWDHGGGSAAGICLDERTGNMLSLNDVRAAFTSAYEPSADNPPFEMIGFDACLMATYDTVNMLDGLTRYVTASEEVEPGLGWNYTGWVGALAENPAMGGAKLGQTICNTYIEACQQYNLDDTVTLSVIDLKQLPVLRNAYESFGLEALRAARDNPRHFFAKFGRGAVNAENYGGNTRQTGYTNMVDIADLAKGTKGILTDTTIDKLVGAVDNAVIYKVNGAYRNRGGGLSSFYSYSGDEQSLVAYLEQDSAPIPQKILYYYLIYGEIPENVLPLLDDDRLVTPVPTAPPAQRQEIFQISQLNDLPVQMDANNNAFVQLTPEQMDLLSSVHCQLAYIDVGNDIILYLGSDADINADWDAGTFTDNFRGVWPMLDGHPVYVEITEENDGYNLYSIPIKLNGVECNLQVAYVYAEEKYYILGARKGLDSHGMSNRELIKLKPGDEITTLHYGMTISGDDKDLTQVEVDTFTVTENTQIKDEELDDGNYGYGFEFVSPTANESATSNVILFTIANGQITTEISVQE